MKSILLIIILYLSILGYMYGENKCTCFGVRNIESYVKGADVVFAGYKTSSRDVQITINENDRGFRYQTKLLFKSATFRIKKVFKGKLNKDTIQIITGQGGGDCGCIFLNDSLYIAFAKLQNHYSQNGPKVRKFLYSDICMGTKLYNNDEAKEIEKIVCRGKNNNKN